MASEDKITMTFCLYSPQAYWHEGFSFCLGHVLFSLQKLKPRCCSFTLVVLGK